MLLLNASGQTLNVAAHQEQTDDHTIWQDGPLDPERPSGDAVLRQRALYFEHVGDMTAAYPHLEEKTGSVATVGSAPIPLVLNGRSLGVLILEFMEPHPFTKGERRFLQALAAQTALIDGMLTLSRSGRQKLQVQSVDLNAFTTQACQDAAAEFGAHPVRWQVGALPTVQGDENLLQQVMTNLLSNAVKYSAKRERSEVRV